MARPSIYTAELADEICLRLAEGRSLISICEDDDMPGESTVYRWLATNDVFREKYARARELQAERMADEILEIADDGRNDWMIRTVRGTETEVENTEVLSRSRLRVDARKWLMSKMLPKKYGDRIAQDINGNLSVGLAQILGDLKQRAADDPPVA